MNVMGIMQQIMSNNRVMGNPMIKNAMSMAQSGNSKGIEQMARNLCKEKGINPDDVMKQITQLRLMNLNLGADGKCLENTWIRNFRC